MTPTVLEASSRRYLLHEPIGHGGMGVIYLGTMVSAAGERPVAIKQLVRQEEATPEATGRIIAEARLVFQLTHANICQVLDIAESKQGTFIVMEYVRGLDLGTLLERIPGQKLDAASALYIARQTAEALDYAHRRSDPQGRALVVVHGDVTPRNLLLSIDGDVKLCDFGVARAVGGAAPGNQQPGGTAGYMAPEWGTRTVDHRSDIYSLGMTLRAALCGLASVERQETPLPHDVSADLRSILGRATARKLAERYLSAADFAREVTVELARHYPAFSPRALGDLVRSLAEEEISVSNAKILGEAESLTDPGRRPITFAAPLTMTVPPPEPRRHNRKVAVIVTVVVAIGTIGLLGRWARLPSPPAPPPTDAAVSHLLASQDLGGSTPVASPNPLALAPVPSPEAPAARRRTPAQGFLTVTSEPWGALYVDGRRVADETPVFRLRLPVGRHRVTVFYPDRGSHSRPQTIVVRSGQVEVIGFHR